jgi:hypothetical protein
MDQWTISQMILKNTQCLKLVQEANVVHVENLHLEKYQCWVVNIRNCTKSPLGIRAVLRVHNQGIKTWNTQFWYTSMVPNFMKKSNTASSFMVISWSLVAPWGFWNNQNWRLFDSVIFQILRTGSSLILIFSNTQTGDSLILILKLRTGPY